MQNIEKYMNELLAFSPIIPNLFYVRDFLTCNRSSDGTVQKESKDRRSVMMNTMVDFDAISKPDYSMDPSSRNISRE